MFKNLTYGWIVCFLGATIAGCGDGLRRVTIEGVVTAQQSPLADATVQFFPKGSTVGEGAIGTTDSNGKFTVTSSRDDAAGITCTVCDVQEPSVSFSQRKKGLHMFTVQ